MTNFVSEIWKKKGKIDLLKIKKPWCMVLKNVKHCWRELLNSLENISEEFTQNATQLDKNIEYMNYGVYEKEIMSIKDRIR